MARWKAVLIVGALGVAAVAAVASQSGSHDAGLTLKTIPSGVSARRFEGVDLFLLRDGRQVIAFVNSAQHMTGEKLWWCQKEQVFAAPTHGETFDLQGHHIGGPASRDRDRLVVKVTDDEKVSIDSSGIQAGAAHPPYPRPPGVPDLAAEWPPGFCGSHVAI